MGVGTVLLLVLAGGVAALVAQSLRRDPLPPMRRRSIAEAESYSVCELRGRIREAPWPPDRARAETTRVAIWRAHLSDRRKDEFGFEPEWVGKGFAIEGEPFDFLLEDPTGTALVRCRDASFELAPAQVGRGAALAASSFVEVAEDPPLKVSLPVASLVGRRVRVRGLCKRPLEQLAGAPGGYRDQQRGVALIVEVERDRPLTVILEYIVRREPPGRRAQAGGRRRSRPSATSGAAPEQSS